MPYTFGAPLEQFRTANPADELVDMVQMNSPPMPLGATSFCCNGINVSRFEPDTPAAAIAGTAGNFRLVAFPPVNYGFTSTVVVPPNPSPTGWRSRVTSWSILTKLVDRFPARTRVRLPPITHIGTVRLVPTLGMCAHIINHERQHVADNKWIVDKAFKPWVDWLDHLAAGAVAYTAREKTTLEWFLGGGVSSLYYGRYLFELATEVSEHFHRHTDVGAAPVYTVTAIEQAGGLYDGDTVLVMELSPKVAIGAKVWNGPPHRCFQLMSVKDFSHGVSTEIIQNGMMAVPDWNLPAIALTQRDIDDKEYVAPVVEGEGDGDLINSLFS